MHAKDPSPVASQAKNLQTYREHETSEAQYILPDLFAGKMHALLCRTWKNRTKGRGWYDLVWYAAHHPRLHITHLESRMIQSGHWEKEESLTEPKLNNLLQAAINKLDINQARNDVGPFVKDRDTLAIWSKEFFLSVIERVKIV